jgi:hypothetical protein
MYFHDQKMSNFFFIWVNKREFLAPGAPCEINIDGRTMDIVQHEMKRPSRFTFDKAAEHVYNLLLKKDCYPRFVRSDHYKQLLANALQPCQKKRSVDFHQFHFLFKEEKKRRKKEVQLQNY